MNRVRTPRDLGKTEPNVSLYRRGSRPREVQCLSYSKFPVIPALDWLSGFSVLGRVHCMWCCGFTNLQVTWLPLYFAMCDAHPRFCGVDVGLLYPLWYPWHVTTILRYNVHPYFSLKNLGKKVPIIHGKIQLLDRDALSSSCGSDSRIIPWDPQRRLWLTRASGYYWTQTQPFGKKIATGVCRGVYCWV